MGDDDARQRRVDDDVVEEPPRCRILTPQLGGRPMAATVGAPGETPAGSEQAVATREDERQHVADVDANQWVPGDAAVATRAEALTASLPEESRAHRIGCELEIRPNPPSVARSASGAPEAASILAGECAPADQRLDGPWATGIETHVIGGEDGELA